MGSFKRINNLMVKSSHSPSAQTFIWTDSRGVLCYETDLKGRLERGGGRSAAAPLTPDLCLTNLKDRTF